MSDELSKEVPILNKQSMGISEGLPLNASEGGIDELRKNIQHMMDMEAIKQLKHAYFRCLDTANMEELATLCHPDLSVHYTGGDYEIKLDNRDEFVRTMTQSFSSEGVGRHNGYMPEIQMLSENEATGIWYLYDHYWALNNKHLTHGTALYWDRYLKLDGHWVIKTTKYQRIYQINENLQENPEMVSHYLATHGAKSV
tara:strand:+ start:454 stop:1047 length:594 start_codon:yes stop_codon:yes gene_type:complete